MQTPLHPAYFKTQLEAIKRALRIRGYGCYVHRAGVWRVEMPGCAYHWYFAYRGGEWISQDWLYQLIRSAIG